MSLDAMLADLPASRMHQRTHQRRELRPRIEAIGPCCDPNGCDLEISRRVSANRAALAGSRDESIVSGLHIEKSLKCPPGWPPPLGAEADPAKATLHKEYINDVSWVDFRGPLQRCHNTGLRTDFSVPG